MIIKKGIFQLIRFTLASIYLWVVADRLGFLGPAGNIGVVWGNFDKFLDYTATLNPWFPRKLSDIFGYLATFSEITLAFFLLFGIRLKETSLTSLALLMIFVLSLTFSLGFEQAGGFILFTVVLALASAFLYTETK